MTQITDTSALALHEEGFDPIEDRLRANIRGTIEAVFNEELDGFLGRLRYGRTAGAVKGYRCSARPHPPASASRDNRFRGLVALVIGACAGWCCTTPISARRRAEWTPS